MVNPYASGVGGVLGAEPLGEGVADKQAEGGAGARARPFRPERSLGSEGETSPLKFIACLLLTALCISCALTSCATKRDAYKHIDAAVNEGKLDKAIADITADSKKQKIYNKKSRVLYNLDKGILEHYDKRYGDSLADIDDAKYMMNASRNTTSISEGAASALANDNAQTYSGAIYEYFYGNIFLALNYYFLGKKDTAAAIARELIEDLQRLNLATEREIAKIRKEAQKAQDAPAGANEEVKPFNNSALANYLILVLRRYSKDGNSSTRYLDAMRQAYADYPAVYGGAAKFPKGLAAEGADVAPGMARLNFIVWTGLSPVKTEEDRSLPLPGASFFMTAAAAGASGSRNAFSEAYISEVIAPFKINIKLPKMSAPRSSKIDKIIVEIEGHPPFALDLVEDMGKVIKFSFDYSLPGIRTRTYTRSVTKSVVSVIALLVAQAAAEQIDGVAGILAQLGVLAAKAAVSAALEKSEEADIRMARYLPDKAFGGGITVKPGTYKARLTFFSEGVQTGEVETNTIEVKADEANIYESVRLK